MAPWRHPRLGPIEQIPQNLQPKKVWKHFYASDEHWARLGALDPLQVRGDVESLVGIRRDDSRDLPKIPAAQWKPVRHTLSQHHDGGYAPVYRAEMADEGTVWTPTMDAAFRHHALTPRSIHIVVELSDPCWVVTAFRPHPPTKGVEWEEADFRRHAVDVFEKETGMTVDDPTRSAIEGLRRASANAPRNVRDLWWLASAVGYARPLSADAGVAAALAPAEALLRGTLPSLREALAAALDWQAAEQQIAAGLKDERPEELESALSAIEGLLAVATAIGEERVAEEYCGRAEQLLVWLRPEWAFFSERAEARRRSLADQGLLARLWEAVADAAASAVLREAPAVVQPVARFADDLISRATPLRDLLTRLVTRAGQITGAVQTWVENSVAGIQVLQPAPAMGAADAEAEPWDVSGRPAHGKHFHRAFVVDDDYPDGYEVTEHFTATDGLLWRLSRPGDRAEIVIVAGDTAIEGATLNEVLSLASRRDDLVVRSLAVNRPK